MLAALGRALSSVAIVLQCSVLVAGGTGVSALGSGALAGDGLRIAQADPDSREAETTFWNAVKDSGDADMIESYRRP